MAIQHAKCPRCEANAKLRPRDFSDQAVATLISSVDLIKSWSESRVVTIATMTYETSLSSIKERSLRSSSVQIKTGKLTYI